jgi:hypothetical protein
MHQLPLNAPRNAFFCHADAWRPGRHADAGAGAESASPAATRMSPPGTVMAPPAGELRRYQPASIGEVEHLADLFGPGQRL